MTTTIPQSSSRTPGLVAINALGPSGEYCTPNREIITDTAGVAVAECTIVPPLYVTRTIAAQRRVRPLPTARREVALAKTAEIFANSVIGHWRLADRIGSGRACRDYSSGALSR